MIAFCLKEYVSDRKCLVYNQNLRIDVNRNRKGKAYKHTAGIGLNRLLDIIADVCKFQNTVQLFINFFFGKTNHGTI